jgi:hypothetical protein
MCVGSNDQTDEQRAPGHRDHVEFATPARTGTDGQAYITSLETEPAASNAVAWTRNSQDLWIGVSYAAC